MFDGNYRKRLSQDLPLWRERGWVSEDGASAILNSVDAAKGPGFGLAALVAVLGAVLLGLGVFAFIGANWEYMPRIVRFGLLLLAMALAYGAAAELQRRDLPAFADAAVLIGGLVFAGSIALVGQTYHLSGDFADAVLLWLAGALVAALATRSVSATVLYLVGAGYWSWLSTVDNEIVPHAGGLVAVLLGLALAVWLDSRPARSAAVLALGFWIVVTTFGLGDKQDWSASGAFALLACVGLALWSLGVLLATFASRPRIARFGADLQWPALAGFVLAAGVLQVSFNWGTTADNDGVWTAIAVAALVAAMLIGSLAQQRGAIRFLDVVAVAVLGAAVIGLALWPNPDEFGGGLAGGIIIVLAALWWISMAHAGQPIGNKPGLIMFGAEVLYLYGVTLGSLIDTALAFLLGGVLFIALSFVLLRFDRRLAAREAEALA